jgi:hypothetical protein
VYFLSISCLSIVKFPFVTKLFRNRIYGQVYKAIQRQAIRLSREQITRAVSYDLSRGHVSHEQSVRVASRILKAAISYLKIIAKALESYRALGGCESAVFIRYRFRGRVHDEVLNKYI